MRIAIVTNILTPYRISFYKELSVQLKEKKGELKVFALTESLPLRPWTFENLKEDFTMLVPGKKVFIKGEDYLFNIAINRYLTEFNPDIVVIAGSWTYPTLWHVLLHKDKKVKYFFWTESHNQRATKVGTSNPVVMKLKQKFYEQFDGFCVPGKYARETVDKLIDSNKTYIRLPNLVDNDFFEQAIIIRKQKEQLREKYNIKPEQIAIICPARLISLKGIVPFLENAAQSKYIKRFIFLFAGDGPEKKNIEKISNEKGIETRLLGYCDQAIVRELYSISDIFLLPSLQDANPLTSIEAAFSGLPLLVSIYTGNSPELVLDGENGILFDTIDTKSVIEAIDFLACANKEWYQEAGNKSLAIARKSFEGKKETSKLINSFESILSI